MHKHRRPVPKNYYAYVALMIFQERFLQPTDSFQNRKPSTST